ncbi:MAG: hypothetical protein ABIR71_02695 [Chthoniobacterales bacterium]
MSSSRGITKFSNIRVTNDGFQVVFVRAGIELRKYFAGHSPESLRAALKFRDRALKEIPDKRLNIIPKRVLKALGLEEPVVGVFRPTGRNHYSVTYTDRDGRKRSRAFSWRHRDEEVAAYAKAAAFRKKTLRGI